MTESFIVLGAVLGVVLGGGIVLAITQTSGGKRAGFYAYDHATLLVGFWAFMFLPGELIKQLNEDRFIANDATKVHFSYGDRTSEFRLAPETLLNGTAFCDINHPGLTLSVDCHRFEGFLSPDPTLMSWNLAHAAVVLILTIIVIVHMFQNQHSYGTLAFYATIIRQRRTRHFRWTLYVLLLLVSLEISVPFVLVAHDSLGGGTSRDHNGNAIRSYRNIDLVYLVTELSVICAGAWFAIAGNLARFDDYYPEEWPANCKLTVPFHWRTERVMARVELAFLLYSATGRTDVLRSVVAGEAMANELVALSSIYGSMIYEGVPSTPTAKAIELGGDFETVVPAAVHL